MKYSIKIFYSEEDEGYIALSEELDNISAFGATEEEALKEIKNCFQNTLLFQIPFPPQCTLRKCSVS